MGNEVTANEAPEGWITFASLAAALGVSKASVSRRVCILLADGYVKTRRRGREKILERVAFDRAVKLAAEAARKRKILSSIAKRARMAENEADLAELQFDPAKKRRITPDHAAAALLHLLSVLSRLVEAFPERAAELAEAVAEDGAAGMQRVVDQITRDVAARVPAVPAERSAKLQTGELVRGLKRMPGRPAHVASEVPKCREGRARPAQSDRT